MTSAQFAALMLNIWCAAACASNSNASDRTFAKWATVVWAIITIMAVSAS